MDMGTEIVLLRAEVKRYKRAATINLVALLLMFAGFLVFMGLAAWHRAWNDIIRENAARMGVSYDALTAPLSPAAP